MSKLKLISGGKEKCLVCQEWAVIPIMESGGSSIIISLSKQGVSKICQNCGAKYG